MARSANLDFFAAQSDQRAVLDFLFLSTDVRVFESYSEFSADLREFRSTDELSAAFPIGFGQHGNGSAILLKLWSPSVMRDLTITRFNLDPSYCNGHTFRHRIDGVALMQLYLGGVCGRFLTKSHFGHWSRARAEVDGVAEDVNWDAFKRLSNRIQYHIRKRLAASKVGSNPVLPSALELAQNGYALIERVRMPRAYKLDSVGEWELVDQPE